MVAFTVAALFLSAGWQPSIEAPEGKWLASFVKANNSGDLERIRRFAESNGGNLGQLYSVYVEFGPLSYALKFRGAHWFQGPERTGAAP